MKKNGKTVAKKTGQAVGPHAAEARAKKVAAVAKRAALVAGTSTVKKAEAKPAAKPAAKAEAKTAAPKVGKTLVRPYKGKELRVKVVADGFLFQGKTYASLSALGKHITGWPACDGPRFFGLRQPK